jgi:hypothetical protein
MAKLTDHKMTATERIVASHRSQDTGHFKSYVKEPTSERIRVIQEMWGCE